jgi:hypothetical protein
MLIKVMYQDGKIGEIESYQLDDLIHSQKIKKFQRSGKWVKIGIDPIRGIKEDYLEIPERQQYSKKEKKKR